MFDPLPGGGGRPQPPSGSEWRIIMPVPEDAPTPSAEHPKLGMPTNIWEYRDGTGRLLGLVCRWDLKNGDKEIRNLVHAEHRTFGRQWRWRGFPRPRPLYGLDRLAARPDAPVVIAEGEKAADAAAVLLPNHVTVTSPGGSKAAKAADWSALADRKVTIWPDADQAGQAYADAVSGLLMKLSPKPSVAIITPQAGVAEGWDAADALAEGWTPARANGLIAAAHPATVTTAEAAPRKPTARDGLIALIEDEIELWHDLEEIAYATVMVGGHREHRELASRRFRSWFSWFGGETLGVTTRNAIDEALSWAEGSAIYRGPCHKTWRRVAEYDGRIYIDLGCPNWRAIEISASGWRVVAAAPVKFLRSPGIQPLPEPEAGETIELLREFVHVETDADFHLILAWMVAALRPDGPFPILLLTGQQGASKSTVARVCRSLVDPNVAPLHSPPKEEGDLNVVAFNSWVLMYDNLSGLPVWFADALCRLSTGGGSATRAKYTDREQIIFEAQRPVALTAIGDIAAARSDLAERTVSITLPPIPEDQRRTEREFWASFEAARPKILGALLNGLSAGLRHLPNVKLESRSRMADFEEWAEACGPGFGWEPGEFLADYAANRRSVTAAAAEASPLVPIIEAVLGRTGLGPEGFEGTMTELLRKLHEVCGERQQQARWFPRTAISLGTQIARIAPLLLRDRGIEVSKGRAGHDRTRATSIRCVSDQVYAELVSRMRGGGGRETKAGR